MPIDDPKRAGRGEPDRYLIIPRGASTDGVGFQPGEHYVSVDAARWYVNSQGNIFTRKMATGVVTVSVGGERYSIALGRFDLDGGTRTAPIFDRAIIPQRAYVGGDLRIEVHLGAVRQDTALGTMLKGAAEATVGVAAGSIAAATATGPALALQAAGGSLIAGVRRALAEAPGQKEIFDPHSGIEWTADLQALRSRETYVLTHRGTRLDRSMLKVRVVEGTAVDVLYDGDPLRDGAWVLFRVRREHTYGGTRPWQQDARDLRVELDGLVDRFAVGDVAAEDALAALRGTGGEPPTFGDEVHVLNARIRKDYTLTEAEALVEASKLRALLASARDAVESGDVGAYRVAREGVDRVRSLSDTPGESHVGRAVRLESAAMRRRARRSVLRRPLWMAGGSVG